MLFAHDSAVASLPCPSGHIKKRIKGKSKILPNSPIGFYLRDAIRHCKNINTKLFIHPHLSKNQEVKNEWEVSVKRRYKRTKFGYTEVIYN